MHTHLPKKIFPHKRIKYLFGNFNSNADLKFSYTFQKVTKTQYSALQIETL